MFEVTVAAPTLRCPKCGKSRILSHPELLSLSIAHVDCDAFYAAVEKRDNPEIANRPVIIGGEHRGVVATACYIARINGVRSAMPMYKAKKLCPDAIIVRPRMNRYREVSRAIREKFDAMTPFVEPLSIDEAFLDLTGTERLHGKPPAALLATLAREVEQEIGISISIGLAPNKFLAKLASDLEKPRGFTIIGKAEALDILSKLPITKIYGIGAKTSARLKKDGLTEISQLQELEEAPLIRRYGETGQKLFRLSRGIDVRRVENATKRKSVSSEHTLNHDLADYFALEDKLWNLCEKVAADLKRKQLSGLTVTLKLKNSMHQVITRSHTLDTPTQLAETLFEHGKALLLPLANGTTYRLIGIGMSHFRPLIEADQPDLIEPQRAKRENAERAMDKLKERFGTGSVKKGRGLSAPDANKPRNPAK
jgi:DNA polymerase-4